MGGEQDRTADELQRNQAERRNAAACALLSFVLFVAFVVKKMSASRQPRDSTENVANKRMHPSRRTVRLDHAEITPATW